MNTMSELQTLKLPPKADYGINSWIDERIWGHRIRNIQPWLVFLEFISICEARMHAQLPVLSHDDIADENNEPCTLAYEPAQRIQLRNIVNNPLEEKIEKESGSLADSAKWDRWESQMRDECKGFPNPKPDFKYVRGHFHSFRDFALLVQSLRGFIIEETENKRWSSQFLFPFGADTIYDDLAITQDSHNRDYNNFTRSGAMLYDMLCRSTHKDELNALLPKLLATTNPWNLLCKILQNPDPNFNKRDLRSGSILPYKTHPRFNVLAADFCSILKLDIPEPDVMPHLVALTGLHLTLYVQEISCAVLEREPTPFICELLSPHKTTIRRHSIASFDENRRLSSDALDKELERIEQTFAAGNGCKDVEEAKKFLKENVGWDPDEGQVFSSAEGLFETLKLAVRKVHRDHLGKVHSDYGRGVGLVSRRGTNRNRYAPSDEFLKTVTLATVPHRMEYKALLRHLHQKYHLVFGDMDAFRPANMGTSKSTKSRSKSDFKLNSERLERRLASLGLLKRKSDGCAYIFNPHSNPQIPA